MKLFAAFAFMAALSAGPAAAAEASDPRLDFLGLCIKNGSSSNYCACMSDAIGAVLTPPEFAVYNDYLTRVAAGQQDPTVLIEELTKRHGITKKDLGRILKAATDVTSKPETCAGL
jgi:hypothetical protein